MDLERYRELRSGAGDPGRVTEGRQVDPNRQFPELGCGLDWAKRSGRPNAQQS